MVRLTKDAASEPRTSEAFGARLNAVALSLEKLSENIVRTFAPALKLWAEQTRARLSGMYADGRRALWARQYPTYTCPFTTTVWSLDGDRTVTCARTWDRTEVSTGDLRTEVWDHVTTDHMSGEAGLAVASNIVRLIMERP